ncbi:hypothetical protein KAZ01_02050, partial [Candidatus Gracilibacteria bacterium]|nr:hypothetical protein [Candidatus Gracilibacteria bacterium]
DIAYDYFWQTRKEIRGIFKSANSMFKGGFDGNHYDFIKELVIKDYINSEEEIKGIINKKGIIFYISKYFYKNHKQIFKQKGIEFNKPYYYLKENLNAINNSFNYSGDSLGFSLKQTKYIGTFITKDGKEYGLGTVNINGKNYITHADYGNEYMLNYLDSYTTKKIAGEILETLKNIE